MVEVVAVPVAERAALTTLRQRDRTWVKDRDATRQLLLLGDMRVAVCEDRAHADGRERVFVPAVSVREEEALAVRVEFGVVGHHREVKQKLIHFRIAISAHGEDLVLVRVEDVGDFRRVVEIGHAVARTMVHEVAEQDQTVVTQAFALFKSSRQS